MPPMETPYPLQPKVFRVFRQINQRKMPAKTFLCAEFAFSIFLQHLNGKINPQCLCLINAARHKKVYLQHRYELTGKLFCAFNSRKAHATNRQTNTHAE